MHETLSEIGYPLVVALLLGLAALGRAAIQRHAARRLVHCWLLANTQDEPGESHAVTVEIAKGTGLAEGRVRQACLSDKRIHRASGEVDRWSVWRKEPQSVYEKRGLVVF